jgi:hypothetical protein
MFRANCSFPIYDHDPKTACYKEGESTGHTEHVYQQRECSAHFHAATEFFREHSAENRRWMFVDGVDR